MVTHELRKLSVPYSSILRRGTQVLTDVGSSSVWIYVSVLSCNKQIIMICKYLCHLVNKASFTYEGCI